MTYSPNITEGLKMMRCREDVHLCTKAKDESDVI